MKKKIKRLTKDFHKLDFNSKKRRLLDEFLIMVSFLHKTASRLLHWQTEGVISLKLFKQKTKTWEK